jgi:Flp pilus assembly CpaF family ATPase
MNMLGWRILKQGEYFLDIPILSSEEKEIVITTEQRFKEATRDSKEEGELLIEKLVKNVAEESGIFLDTQQEEYLSRIAVMHIYGFAFMDDLVNDPHIEEISVIGPKKPVYVYLRNEGWKRVNACFEDEKSIADMINKMSRNIGRHITMQNPRIDAMLPDGSRLHGSLSPISEGEITIRKFRDRPFSPLELVKNNSMTIDVLAFLSVLMQCDSSIMIAGNTASGKTTTLNALFSFVPSTERVIISEETPEINVPHKHQMRLVANKDMEISLKDLVYDSLRMRPDRMIVGEVRNKEEAEALFDVLMAGQARGSYATFHAQSVNEAISRLRSFGINEMDIKSIDCIIIQRRMLFYDKKRNVEVRKIVEIAETGQTIYHDGKLKHGNLIEKMAHSFGMSKKEMLEELKERKKIIARAPLEYIDFYESIQKKFYGGVE